MLPNLSRLCGSNTVPTQALADYSESWQLFDALDVNVVDALTKKARSQIPQVAKEIAIDLCVINDAPNSGKVSHSSIKVGSVGFIHIWALFDDTTQSSSSVEQVPGKDRIHVVTKFTPTDDFKVYFDEPFVIKSLHSVNKSTFDVVEFTDTPKGELVVTEPIYRADLQKKYSDKWYEDDGLVYGAPHADTHRDQRWISGKKTTAMADQVIDEVLKAKLLEATHTSVYTARFAARLSVYDTDTFHSRLNLFITIIMNKLLSGNELLILGKRPRRS